MKYRPGSTVTTMPGTSRRVRRSAGCPSRPWNGFAPGPVPESTDIVNLQTQQVPQSMRQEVDDTPVATASSGDMSQQAGIAQQLRDQMMGSQVQVAPVDARRARLPHSSCCRCVHAFDQGGEHAGSHGPGAGDVAGIAGAAGTGIDQQRMRFVVGLRVSRSW